MAALKTDELLPGGETLRVKVVLESGSYVEDKNYSFSGQRTLDNSVSAGLLNQIKDILEEITATIGNVDQNFRDPSDPNKRSTIGSRIRAISTDLEDILSASVQGLYISGLVGAGFYQDQGLEAALYPAALSNIGTLEQKAETLPTEELTLAGDFIPGQPTAIEGAVQTSFNTLYMGPGTAVGNNLTFETGYYHKIYVQHNTPILLDLNLGDLSGVTYEPAQVFDKDVAADYDIGTKTIKIRNGFQFPVFNGVLVNVTEKHAAISFQKTDRSPATGTNLIYIDSTSPSADHFVFKYASGEYTTYAALLGAMGNNPTPDMMRSVVTEIVLSSSNPPGDTQYIVVKYAFYPERWLGLAATPNGLELIYKYGEGEVNTNMFLSGDLNDLYDRFLPRPVGTTLPTHLRGSRAAGVMLHDIYVNPIQAQFTTQQVYTQRHAARIQKAVFKNDDGDSAFGSALIAPADNVIASAALGDIATMSASAESGTWTITDGVTESGVNLNLSLQKDYDIQPGIFYTRGSEITAKNPEAVSSVVTMLSDNGTPVFSFPAQEGSKLCIRMIAASTSTAITDRLRIRAANITFSDGTSVSNVDLYLPLTSEVRAYCGYLPETIYLFYAYRNGKTLGYFDSALQHPFYLRKDLGVDPNPLEGRGIKHDQISFDQVEGSRTAEAAVPTDLTLKNGIVAGGGTPTVEQTAAGSGKVRHIKPFSLGSIDIGDEALAERQFPGASVVGGADANNRVRGSVILKASSVLQTEIERNPQVSQALTLDSLKTSANVASGDKSAMQVFKEQIGERASEALWGTSGDNVSLIAMDIPPQVGTANVVTSDPAGVLNPTYGVSVSAGARRDTGLHGTQIQDISSASRAKLIESINYLFQRIKHLEENVFVKKDADDFYLKDKIRSKHINLHGALAPIGAIVDLLPGYFSNSANGGYTAFVTNNISGINAWLSTNYGGAWLVCDGNAPNDAESPIFNTAGRYLPNLTDSRFVMGSTSGGAIGGTNDMVNHSHTGSSSGGSTGGSDYPFRMAISGFANSAGSHSHGLRTLYASTNGAAYFVNAATLLNPNQWVEFPAGTNGIVAGGDHTHTTGGFAYGGDGNEQIDTGAGFVTGKHSHSFSGLSVSVGGSYNPATATPGQLENRPKFLSTFKIMRIK